jgi:two-component system phosphate regulon sensor histidine kinase PhoR
MIFAVISIILLSASFALASIIVLYFKYLQRFFKDPDEFKRSHNILLLFLGALFLHSMYHLSGHYALPLENLFEITSVISLLAIMFILTRQAVLFEVLSEVRKEDKVRQLVEFRTLQDRLSNTSRELMETKNFYQGIIQSSADAIVASDNDKKITYFSTGAEELFERKAQDVLGSSVLELYPREVVRKRDRIKRASKLKKSGVIRNMSMKINTPSGKQKTISLSLALLKDAREKVNGTVGVAKDITQEVKAANEINALKELKGKILEGTPEGLLLLDLGFKISIVNNGFEKITGIEKDAIMGKNALDYLKIPELERLFEAMKLKEKFVKVAYDGKSLDAKEFNIIVKGKKKTFADYWTPLFDSQGKVEFVLIILQDLTSRKALEENLKDQAEMLKRSNALKDIFTDIMRHDLLNPIGVIKNYVELLSEENLDPSVKHGIDAISRNANKAVGMIENASRLAKIESIKEITFEEKDLGVLLMDTVEILKSRAAKKGIALVIETKGSFSATVTFIDAVFLNLLTNAIKYSPPNTKVITGIEDAGKKWKIYVKDNGEGIDDKFKETVFTRFERLKREGVKGTGLGLAIVKRIVEIHRGRVWVEDNPEGGSIFYVEIPKKI